MVDLNNPTSLAQPPAQTTQPYGIVDPTAVPTGATTAVPPVPEVPEPLTFDPMTFENSTGFASPYAPAEFVDATPIGSVPQVNAPNLAAPQPLQPLQQNNTEDQRVALVDNVANTEQSSQIQQAPVNNTGLATPPAPQVSTKPEFNPNVGQYKPNQGLQIRQASSPQFLGSIAMAQSIMKNKTLNLDSQQNAQFGEYSTAFNNKGELIPNGMDANGIQTIRGIDAEGNLGIAKVDAQGRIKPQGIINLDQMQDIISRQSQELTR